MTRRRRTLGSETIKLNTVEVRDSIAKVQANVAALVVIQGAESDLGLHVLVDRPITLGRDSANELALEDDGISRRHCRVFIDDGRYYVEDLRSTNGTLLNGTPLKAKKQLKAGDRIYLGGCVVKFTRGDDIEVGYHATMDQLVGTDDLTGLIAKRRFDAAYVRAFAAARSRKSCLAVMMLDLDGIKRINDTHGHPFGAYTIAEAGRLIGKALAGRGYACRFGGDEFAAFVPGVDKAAAANLGEEIRRAVAGHHFEKDGVLLRPTISIGVAAFPDDAGTPEEVLRCSDEALYRAKRTGRDRVGI
jgi:diguanylate cyclase (GGDEF)-like protein